MIKFEPYFHVGGYELASAMHDLYPEVSTHVWLMHLCDMFNVTYHSDETHLVYTSYSLLLEQSSTTYPPFHDLSLGIVKILSEDNVNVLGITDTFCIEI